MAPRIVFAFLAAASLTTPLAAETAVIETQSASSIDYSQFAPDADVREHRIDYQHWDEALAWIVIPMGPSIREGAPRVEPLTGTRRIYGHESRYRLEGNRVAFSLLEDEVIAGIRAYRSDLERMATELEITRLPRNEQLAFWINLHNIAIVEALAGEYPLARPEDRTFGANGAGLDDAKLVSVNGVALSPREIREEIVYANWRDPKVMYGFWRGTIGGPSIQRLAYTGENVDALLSLSAEEFVNSLRGVEEWGDTLRVSQIYEEAAPYYFSDFGALRAHLSQFAAEDVGELLRETDETAYNSFDGDIADMTRGEYDPDFNFVSFIDCRNNFCRPGQAPAANAFVPYRTRPDLGVQRLMRERALKLQRAEERGIRLGMVIFGDGRGTDGAEPAEVE